MFTCVLILCLTGIVALIVLLRNKQIIPRHLLYIGLFPTYLLIGTFPLYVIYCKTQKHLLSYRLQHLPIFTINEIDGYYNVHDQLQWKSQLKSLHKKKWWKKHKNEKKLDYLRLASTQILPPPLKDLSYKNIPSWIHTLVNEEFSFYTFHPFSISEIRKTLLEYQSFGEGWEKEVYLALFAIRNGTLFVKDYSNKHARLQDLSVALDRLCRSAPLPDLDFLVSFHDHLENTKTHVPIFVFSKKCSNKKMVLIPDHEQLMGYEDLNTVIDTASTLSPWNTKKDLAFWRGGTTGGVYTDVNWKNFPRVKLTLTSVLHPELLDAKFSSLVQGASTHHHFFLQHNMISPVVYPQEQVQYRYLVDVDGNASTYSRFYWILRSNCTPLKQTSQFIQWYYPLLIPYNHYIPIQEDLSDLQQQLNWTKNHPEKAHLIAENSSNFAKEHLTTEHAFLYLYALLLEYSNYFNNETLH